MKAGLFKLSISYIHLFRSRYQYPVFHLAYQYLRNLLDGKQKADKPGTTYCKQSYRKFVNQFFMIHFWVTDDWHGLEVSRIHEGGSAAMAVTLFALGIGKFRYQIPEQIIIFDPKLKVSIIVKKFTLYWQKISTINFLIGSP